MDYVGFLVVTAGQGVREKANELKDNGDYLRSHALQSVALEVAEAMAERVHHLMRDTWGFPDPPEMTMKQRSRRPLSRHSCFVRLSGLSESGGSGAAVRADEA